MAVEQPKQSDFGELALPVAFQLARILKKSPKAIAVELASELPPIEGVAKMEVAGSGYINLRLDRSAYGDGLLRGTADGAEARAAGKALMDEGKAAGSGKRTFIFVNNRLEGNALGTIAAMLQPNTDV